MTTTAPKVYEPGDEVAITFNVTDNAGVDYDPATVKFHYINPAGTLSTKIVGTDSVATKVSAGHYKLLIYIPYAAASVGEWHYDAQALDGSANSLKVEAGTFRVKAIRTV